MRKYSADDVRDKLYLEISKRCTADFASRFLRGASLSDGSYLIYFTLIGAFDTLNTVRIAFFLPRGRTKVMELSAKEARVLTEHPRAIASRARALGAKKVVVCISAPRGYGVDNAFAVAQKTWNAVGGSLLFDYVLIEKGEVLSLIRGNLV